MASNVIIAISNGLQNPKTALVTYFIDMLQMGILNLYITENIL